MARRIYNGLSVTIATALTASGTTITFNTALTHSVGVAVPTITGGDYISLAFLDATTGRLREIVWLTAYTTGTTTGTITRAKEATTGIAHGPGVIVANTPTILDWSAYALPDRLAPGASATTAYITDANTATTSGFYYVAGGVGNNTALNAEGHLSVSAYSTNYLVQRFTPYASDLDYFRRNNGGTWGPWVQQQSVLDTGWRNILSLVPALGTRTMTRCAIRRTGWQVNLHTTFADSQTSPTRVKLFDVPTGFIPLAAFYHAVPYDAVASPQMLNFYNRGDQIQYGGPTNASNYECHLSWSTAQPWPGSLPGVVY